MENLREDGEIASEWGTEEEDRTERVVAENLRE